MKNEMKRLIASACAAFLATSAPAIAQLPSNSVPVFIGDERVLVGRYHYEEKNDNFKIDVHLNADHTALYHITSGPADSDFIKAEGFWTVEGDVIHIHNKPGPVRLERAGPPTLDPQVSLFVTVTNADGSPAEGLGVTWPNAHGLYAMSDGQHTISAREKLATTKVYILRLSDRKDLATLDFKPGQPNSFRFIYHPSNVEPFDIPAIALDAKAQTLEVEVGTAYAKLQRMIGHPGQ